MEPFLKPPVHRYTKQKEPLYRFAVRRYKIRSQYRSAGGGSTPLTGLRSWWGNPFRFKSGRSHEAVERSRTSGGPSAPARRFI